jgi:hypothetical protein
MRPDGHVAFKVTWVYGKTGPFTSPFAAEGRETNIRIERKVWCSQSENLCHKAYMAGNARGPVRSSPRYDVDALREWGFGGGFYHHGPRRGQPISLRFAKIRKLAFLMSQPVEAKESDRVVLGFFEIADLTGPDGDVWVSGKTGVRVPTSSLHNAPRFWKFYRQSGRPRWGCGLFRYMSDVQAMKLKDAVMKAAGRNRT